MKSFSTTIIIVLIKGGSKNAAVSKMKLIVMIINGFQPLTIITKCSILDVAAVLDPPLLITFDLCLSIFLITCFCIVLHETHVFPMHPPQV